MPVANSSLLALGQTFASPLFSHVASAKEPLRRGRHYAGKKSRPCSEHERHKTVKLLCGDNMSDLALHDASVGAPVAKPNLDQKPHVSVALVFILLLVAGIGYAAYGILTDTSSVGEPLALTALILLGIALMIAL